MNKSSPSQSAPPRFLPLAIAGAAILVAAGGALFYFATVSKRTPVNDGAIAVEIGDKACTPNALTVPAGRRTFAIHNASTRPVEWEILDGIMVVEERENILPGFSQTLTATLKPGSYEITCGLLSNPRGTLTVTPSAESDAAAKTGVDLKAFIGPLSEYKVYLVLQSMSLVSATKKLDAAIQAGDLAQSKALYEPAREPYRRIEALVGRWSDLQNAIDPGAAFLEKREQDPAFTGFHRIEYGLFTQSSTVGLAPVADKLVTDATELQTRLKALKLTPADLTENSARLARRLADGRIESGEAIYAHTDLADLDASLAGIGKTVALIRPILPASAAAVGTALDQAMTKAQAALATLKGAQGYPAYDTVDAAQRKALADDFRALADSLDAASKALSVE
ncbi:iron uptake system protein EfeO [Segnochrobactrum spirostomi]|uniref:Iron uptake system protein EfeO n=1 Tax=Segnochrobactrum spirostomi TaxID=2608987 RepID=A0A6A7Y9Q3_9HYPH|nr:iron uptake system protein EfeO [Segnochrobactrum spirostomi]MQT15097.1 iron uptake system protein EfeO [Segnochrobactrum spirostomi]